MRNKNKNVLLIMTDEQPIRMVSCYNDEIVNTPNLDNLATEGIRFDNAYTTSPTCTPARAGLLTGIYPHNTGAWANHLPLGKDIRTIGHYFKHQGYRIAYIGKWHLSGLDYFDTGICPEEFDEEYWYDGRRHLDFLGKEKAQLWRSHTLNTVQELTDNNIDREFTWGGQITNKALQFLKEANNDTKPWLLIVSYDEPHGPWTSAPEFLARQEGQEYMLPETFGEVATNKPETSIGNTDINVVKRVTRLVAACTEFVDDEIGKVLQATPKDNTYIVYTSDHGNQLGAHGLMYKGPFMYEESTKIPLLITGPDIPDDKVEERIVSHIDILPTLFELCDFETPPIFDGNSLVSMFSGKSADCHQENRAFIEFNRFQLDFDGNHGFYPIRCLVKNNFKIAINLFGGGELYNLTDDPYEKKNLFYDCEWASLRNQMYQEIITWMYIRRDAFRSPAWENFDWYKGTSVKRTEKKSRMAPWNGMDAQALDYNSGRPKSYDFVL